MKKNLTVKESIAITSMLFGMFFGAGNLIFPAKLGLDAGRNMWMAFAGLAVTAVGMPLLTVAALGITRSDGVLDLASKVGRRYGLFFSTLLYLTIGPLFAIPRCAGTSFAVGAVNLLPAQYIVPAQFVFSFIFFLIVLAFSLRPGRIMTWIGKILNPIFLIFMAILVAAVLRAPVNSIDVMEPAAGYATAGAAFFSGFLEGYNTLDVLAGLAFGIVVVNVVRENGVEDPERIAANTVKSGIFSCLFMGIIYFFIVLISVRCGMICIGLKDGSSILGTISNAYFQSVGAVLILAIVTFACLKTALGLVTSCAEAFAAMYPGGPSYEIWAVAFCIVALVIANFGLSTIVTWCIPVLMFLYPLAITLVLLALFGKFFHHSRTVYAWTTGFTLIAALLDFVNALASTLGNSRIANAAVLHLMINAASRYLPLFDYGLGWLCPAAVGCIIGLWLDRRQQG